MGKVTKCCKLGQRENLQMEKTKKEATIVVVYSHKKSAHCQIVVQRGGVSCMRIRILHSFMANVFGRR